MTGETRLTGKSGRDDLQAIVPAATAGACMAGVPGRVVDQFQTDRRQNCEPLLNDRGDVCSIHRGRGITHAGSTFLNGLTITLV